MNLDEVKLHYLSTCYILLSKSALKLYCSFKVTEKQRRKINEENEKQRQIEMQRYEKHCTFSNKDFRSSPLIVKRILVLLLSRCTFFTRLLGKG